MNALRRPDRSILLVTNYKRLLEYVRPVHVMARLFRSAVRSWPTSWSGTDAWAAGMGPELEAAARVPGQSPFEEGAARLLASARPAGPAWLGDQRAAGAAAFRPPGPHLAPRGLALHHTGRCWPCSWAAAGAGWRSSSPRSRCSDSRSPDGRFRADLSSAGTLPGGVVVVKPGRGAGPVAGAGPANLGGPPDGLAFTALNTALFEDGAFGALPRARYWRRPSRWCSRAAGPARSLVQHPRALVVAGQGARATLAEIYLGGPGTCTSLRRHQLCLADGAEIEYVKLQDGIALPRGTVFAEAARATAHAQSLGAQLSRSELGSGWPAREAP